MQAPTSLHPSDQTLRAFGNGQLDPASAEAVSAHLDKCEECLQKVAGISSDDFLDALRNARPRGDPEPRRSGMDRDQPGAATRPSLPSTGAMTLPQGDEIPVELANHPDYRILRELGRGGMGVVYLAQNKLMGRPEVLKVVSSHLLTRPGVLDRFLAEIRSAAQLEHSNVVTAYSALRLGESVVLAMQYVEGLDLARLVNSRGPLPVANACYYVHQAALGLQHAHEHGMVHRDIKPGNLMLTRQGNRAVIKVLDFGLAKVRSEGPTDGTLTYEGQLLGTPDFIAPEQISDARRADIRADIYSLGCTLYYLLTGGPPFQGASLYDILQAHHSMDAKPLNLVRPDVPVELAALVAKMMAKEPERRFQEPKEVAQALAPFSRKGEGASGGRGTETYQLEPTTEDRSEARPGLATAQPGTARGAVASTLEARRGSTGPSRGTARPAEGDAPARAPGRRPAWVWASAAAAVLAIGLGAAWVAGSLRPRAAERPRVGAPPAVAARAPQPTAPEPHAPSIGSNAPGGPAPGRPGDRVGAAPTGVAPPSPGSVPPRGVAATGASPGPDAGRMVMTLPSPKPGPTPDEVLAGKGLKRSGQVYVLAETEAPIPRLREVQAQSQQLEAQYNANRAKYAAIEADYQRVESEIAALNQQEVAQMAALTPERAALEREEQRLMNESFDHINDEYERERKMRERDRALEEVRKRKDSLPSQQPASLPVVDLGWLRSRRARLQSQLWEMSRRGQELVGQNAALFQSYQALQAEGMGLRDQILYRYSTLKADPEVKSALRELSQGRGPGQGYVLGPADDLPSLVMALKRTALEILLSKGLDYKKGRLHLQHRAVGEIRRAKEGVDAALRRLGDGTSSLDRLREQEKRFKAELARAVSPGQRAQLTARLEVLESQIDRLVKPKGPEGTGTAPDPRGELVRAVAGLRRAVDALQGWYAGLERDPEVRKALQEVGWGGKPIPAPPELALALRELETAESRVEVTSVPLRKDGDRHRVDATLNGRKAASLVVDPAAETVLTARLASEAGVAVSAEEPTVVRTLDGHRVSARRASLRSVQVGRYTAADSPCLVLLEGGAEVAPRLGRGFLDRFGGTIDEATGTLVLGEVRPSASSHASPPTKGGNVPPRPPIDGTPSDRAGQTPGRARR